MTDKAVWLASFPERIWVPASTITITVNGRYTRKKQLFASRPPTPEETAARINLAAELSLSATKPIKP